MAQRLTALLMSKNQFMINVGILLDEIKKTGSLSLGEATWKIKVSAWSIRNSYAPTLAAVPGVQWDGKHFSMIPDPPKATIDGKLEKFIVDSIVKPIKSN